MRINEWKWTFKLPSRKKNSELSWTLMVELPIKIANDSKLLPISTNSTTPPPPPPPPPPHPHPGWGLVIKITTGFDEFITEDSIKYCKLVKKNVLQSYPFCGKSAAFGPLIFRVNLLCPWVSLHCFMAFFLKFQERYHTLLEYLSAMKCFWSKGLGNHVSKIGKSILYLPLQ